MFAKDKVTKSMIDAVNSVVESSEIDESEKVKTSTGMKVYGSSYGNSERARREQLKRPVDDTKGPNKSELAQMSKVKKEETGFGLKDKLIEALKGKQYKLDKNKNNKLDAQDFAILRGQQKEEVEELEEKEGYSAKAARAGKDIGKPGKAFGMIAKKAGERYGSAEAGKRVAGAILAKLRKEEADADWTDEQVDALLEYYDLEEKHMTAADKAEQERIVKGMKKGFAGFRKRYGERAKSVMYATATKQAMKEENLEEGKPDFLDLDKDGNKTEPMKQAAKQSKNTKKEVEEEIDPKVRTKDTITGRKPTDQDNDVGRSSDFKSTKVKFRGGPMKEEVKKSDVPAYLRKARGDKPLTVADAKSGSKDSISSKENLTKARGVTEGKTLSPGQDDAPFEPPYTTGKPDNVKDKSGAVHTPMSRARDLARQAMKRIKTEMLGKAPGNNG